MAGGSKTSTIEQEIYKEAHPPIRVTEIQESRISSSTIEDFIRSANGGPVGLAPAYGSKGVLHTLAIASLSEVIIVKICALKPSSRTRNPKKPSSPSTSQNPLRDKILCRPGTSTYAFRMDRLVGALFLDAGIRLNSAVDLLSVSNDDRNALESLMASLGGIMVLNKTNVIRLFRDNESMKTPSTSTALQAWAACRAATLPSMIEDVFQIPRINTGLFPKKHLQVISKTNRDASRLVALKPDVVKNDVSKEVIIRKGELSVVSVRFKSKLRRTATHQYLKIKTRENGNVSNIRGQTNGTQGRTSTVSVNAPMKGSIVSIYTVGKEAPTTCETLRSNILLRILQGTDDIMSHPFVQRIWLPSEKISWPLVPSLAPLTLYFPSERTLNVSQERAVNLVLSRKHKDRVALIHGPPGTGKTTVIAASVTSVMASASDKTTIWLVAQSNVAVKNIAEKLVELKFTKFRILVSKDFHFEWHEHLYGKINQNLIRSDDFGTDLTTASRQLSDSRVVLCTLSMMSHERLTEIAQIVPPKLIIFDEASQIEVGDYFPLISRFRNSINKLVFIGDDKQLPPYGHADISELQSIFEASHLRGPAVLLDTQYRMPIPIGNFISTHVYKGRLKSEHQLRSPLKTCRFADIHRGVEVSNGRSWVNDHEVEAVIAIAKKLDKHHMSYRIITPYDPQRSNLEKALKNANLPWEDKCFNIDAFQGNEADYIIISLVRSEKLGFLREDRRVNVMLTRCKKGMIICTSRKFIESKAQESLVGKLANALGDETWVKSREILYGTFVPFI